MVIPSFAHPSTQPEGENVSKSKRHRSSMPKQHGKESKGCLQRASLTLLSPEHLEIGFMPNPGPLFALCALIGPSLLRGKEIHWSTRNPSCRAKQIVHQAKVRIGPPEKGTEPLWVTQHPEPFPMSISRVCGQMCVVGEKSFIKPGFASHGSRIFSETGKGCITMEKQKACYDTSNLSSLPRGARQPRKLQSKR